MCVMTGRDWKGPDHQASQDVKTEWRGRGSMGQNFLGSGGSRVSKEAWLVS